MTTTVLVTPLFFGMAHLHHLHEYTVHRGYALSQALPVVSHSPPSLPLMPPGMASEEPNSCMQCCARA
jgi:hypothetical protein